MACPKYTTFAAVNVAAKRSSIQEIIDLTTAIFRLASADRHAHQAVQKVASRELTGRNLEPKLERDKTKLLEREMQLTNFKRNAIPKENLLRDIQHFTSKEKHQKRQLFYIFVVSEVIIIGEKMVYSINLFQFRK